MLNYIANICHYQYTLKIAWFKHEKVMAIARICYFLYGWVLSFCTVAYYWVRFTSVKRQFAPVNASQLECLCNWEHILQRLRILGV
jgi:hypothetical protein